MISKLRKDHLGKQINKKIVFEINTAEDNIYKALFTLLVEPDIIMFQSEL